MSAEQDGQEVLIQLAELRAQMSSMSDSVNEIKSSVKEVIALDRTIAELSIHNQQQAREIQTQWNKIDSNQKDIEAVERKADEWINKGRGAWFTLMVLGGLAQIIVLASVAYTFNHLRTTEDSVLIINQRLTQLEKK